MATSNDVPRNKGCNDDIGDETGRNEKRKTQG